jgi:hypothetical protein
MKTIIVILLSLLAAISLAAGYSPEQQNMINGTQLSWKLATAYAAQDTATFNALVDQWNAWVYMNFGQDPSMIMQKMTGPMDLQKPYILANNTTVGGIVHAIDGNSKMGGANYKTNDINLLPDSAIAQYNRQQEAARAAGQAPLGDGYLGGV